MKNLIAISTVILALCGQAHSATVDLKGQQDVRLQFDNVSAITLDFALPDNLTGYANFGGYVKWSTRADGRQDWDGPWSTCFECGYFGGSWNIDSYSKNAATVNLDFGLPKDVVYVWTKATHGKGSLSYADPSPVTVPPVPTPAAGILLLTALGGLSVLARRRRKSANFA